MCDVGCGRWYRFIWRVPVGRIEEAGCPSGAGRIVESDRKLASTRWRIQIISSDFLTSIRVKGRCKRREPVPPGLLNLYR
ncbi:hypothetical protein DF150_26775 [Burkholderia cenocepacia]|nr:hypothetical protein DF150_26775 [Burkholderia cenocepacia]